MLYALCVEILNVQFGKRHVQVSEARDQGLYRSTYIC